MAEERFQHSVSIPGILSFRLRMVLTLQCCYVLPGRFIRSVGRSSHYRPQCCWRIRDRIEDQFPVYAVDWVRLPDGTHVDEPYPASICQ